MDFELIPNEKYEMKLLEWAKPTWPQPSRPSPRGLSVRGRSRGVSSPPWRRRLTGKIRSGTEPKPRGFQFGAAGGRNLIGTNCLRWRGSSMEKKSMVERTKGRWWALRAGGGWRGLGKLEVATAGSEGVRRRPATMSYSRRKVEFGIGVTPHVSKPHDYVNHMFMRPYVLIKFEV
jgi:hypothetical protein